MRLFSLTAALACASVAFANTVVVTKLHVETVYGNGAPAPSSSSSSSSSSQTSVEATSQAQPQGNQAQASTVLEQAGAASSSSAASSPSTLISMYAPSSSAEPSSSSAEPSSSASSGSDSGIYADIDKCQGIDKDFAKSILEAHNDKRAKHSAKSLSWSKDLYDYASNYASKYSCSGSLKHSGGKYGENLAVGYKTGPDAVDAWYDEGKSYNYGSASSFDHFTQVIWKGTSQVGCAYKDCSSENWGKYIICSYNPAGNMVGMGSQNLQAN
ncbi:Piso0_005031 [Millerozyma farinosa CBS 7064]|uniref:Piso0_005031 protein n=1 Tax=Pichia sorbitophila (strain ATCC MYA-4447 / BCRC 22081 / CBS 7064 / NBRC 10061 / NRRL Y-12695) TaxID=559304 RepID=G8Y133_PICSO|nr:Piso0_005031 [Millerozyma farinosa CBS 7064]